MSRLWDRSRRDSRSNSVYDVLISEIDPNVDEPTTNATTSEERKGTSSRFCTRHWTPEQWDECYEWNKMAWPIGISILFRQLVPLSDLIFLGHLDTEYLAAAATAQLFLGVTSSWVWKSVGNTLNTLCSQAYGAGNQRIVGTWLQVSLLVVTMATAVILPTWWFVGDILRSLGIDEHQCELASHFARYYSIGLLPSYIFVCLSNWLQSGGAVTSVLLANATLVPINIALNFLLVLGLPGVDAIQPLGFIGSPLGSSITYIASCGILLSIAACRGDLAKGWHGWHADALHVHRLKTFLSMSLPSGIGNLLEDGQLQVVAFLAARLGPAVVATHSSFLTFFLVATSLLYGTVKATTIRVGKHLGARNVASAQFVTKLNLAVLSFSAAIMGAAIISLRSVIGSMFSNDPEVHDLAAQIAVPVGISYVLISLFYTSMATLQGQGRTLVIMVAFIVGAWLVSVPLAFVWTIAIPRGLVGLWDALIIGYSATTVISLIGILRSDWPALAEAAIERNKARLQKIQEEVADELNLDNDSNKTSDNNSNNIDASLDGT